jgi:hypothetical protein
MPGIKSTKLETEKKEYLLYKADNQWCTRLFDFKEH